MTRIAAGIKNLIAWFPIIWNDRQWDFEYFYILMHRKLILMEKYHEKYNPFESKEETVSEIRMCRTLCKKLIGLAGLAPDETKKKFFESLDKYIHGWWV